MDAAATARKALKILDTDGWNKGYTTKPAVWTEAAAWAEHLGRSVYREWASRYKAGSHCIGGLWNLADHGYDGWRVEDTAYVEPLADAVAALFPQWDWRRHRSHDVVHMLANWNNSPDTTVENVRAALESLAAV
jgi:hypothetical protein